MVKTREMGINGASPPIGSRGDRRRRGDGSVGGRNGGLGSRDESRGIESILSVARNACQQGDQSELRHFRKKHKERETGGKLHGGCLERENKKSRKGGRRLRDGLTGGCGGTGGGRRKLSQEL